MSLIATLIPLAVKYGGKFLKERLLKGDVSSEILAESLGRDLKNKSGAEVQEVIQRYESSEEQTHIEYLALLKQDASGDRFQRYWRPFIAWAFGVECFSLVAVLVYSIAMGADISNFERVSSYLLSILGLQAGVVGYYVGQRTLEKRGR